MYTHMDKNIFKNQIIIIIQFVICDFIVIVLHTTQSRLKYR